MLFSFRKYMLHLFVCVVFESKKHVVRAHSIKNGKFIHTYEKSFEEEEKLLKYVKKLISDFQLYYVAVFFDEQIQGLIPSQNPKDILKYGVNLKNVYHISASNSILYASKNSVNEVIGKFQDFGGLDFVFSPLTLLYYCLSTQKSTNTLKCCIYRHSTCIAIMICKEKDIYFGSFFDLDPKGSELEKKEIDSSKEDDEAEDIRIENYDLDKLDNLLDEKLDDLKYSSSLSMDLSDFSQDMQMCSYIFMSLKEFYNNPLYEGNFIDEMIIYDNENISEAVLGYIENEIFLRPQVVHIDTLELMNDLMRKELNI